MILAELTDPRSIVALLALFVAVWSIISSRKHNKLTVRPHLYECLESDSVNLKCGFYLKNKGLGPAIIISTTYYLDGVVVELRDLLNVVEKLPSEFGIYAKRLKPNSAVSKDEICKILEIKWDYVKYDLPSDKETRMRVIEDLERFARQISKRLGVVVEWKSIYGEKGKIDSHPN